MPSVKKQAPELDPRVTYVAWQSFSIDVDGYPLDVAKGTRLKGDHATVKASWWFWLPDGADPAELAARQRELYPESDPTRNRMSGRSRRRRCATRMRWCAFAR